MPLLTKEQLLEKGSERNTLDIHVPEWGGELRVRALSVAERQRFENHTIRASAANNGKPNMIELRERLLAMSIVDDAGNRMFTDKEVAKLSDLDGAVADRVFDEIRDFNGMADGSIEAEVGNLSSGLSAASSTS